MKRPLHIVQINRRDDRGGDAIRNTWALHRAYRKKGIDAWLMVERKFSADESVFEIPNHEFKSGYTKTLIEAGDRLQLLSERIPFAWRGGETLKRVAEPGRYLQVCRDGEDFYYPASMHIPELCPRQPDIIDCHDLKGYFDLHALPFLSQRFPVVLTLHDEWLLKGDHKRILKDGRFYIASPSKLLTEKAGNSFLSQSITEAKTIPYGVELSVFKPKDKSSSRAELKIGPSTKVVLSVKMQPPKADNADYTAIRDVIRELSGQRVAKEVLVVVLGEPMPSEKFKDIEMRFIPYPKNPENAARFYQAADVYLHTDSAPTFSLAVLEALACGVPVVTTAADNCLEQREDKVNNFIIYSRDISSAALRIKQLLNDEALCQRLGREAIETCADRYDLNRQVDDYLTWYEKIMDKNGREQKKD